MISLPSPLLLSLALSRFISLTRLATLHTRTATMSKMRYFYYVALRMRTHIHACVTSLGRLDSYIRIFLFVFNDTNKSHAFVRLFVFPLFGCVRVCVKFTWFSLAPVCITAMYKHWLADYINSRSNVCFVRSRTRATLCIIWTKPKQHRLMIKKCVLHS